MPARLSHRGGLVLIFVCISAALYLLVCAAAYMAQAKLVFFPGPPPRLTPAAIGLSYEDAQLTTRDGEQLHAWFIGPLPTPPARTPNERTPTERTPNCAILVCHGNAGSIEDRLHLAEAFSQMDLAVLLFDYRGYGGSSGAPTEEGLYADAEAAYAYLTTARGFPPDRVIVYGESMGGAVAIELAASQKTAALIVEDTFTSLADTGARHYPWLPVRWLTRFRFDSLAKVGHIEAPKLFIHSRDDEIVPYELGRALFEAAREPKQFLATSGSHNSGGFTIGKADVARVAEFVAATH
jgi:fermentation-respiration switch protein FrsA (DUF1100 family)